MMKSNYSKSIRLRCIVCGSDSDFEYNEERTYIKCTRCNKEYFGGYDELVELNQEMIANNLEDLKIEVADDLKKELSNSIRRALKR